ncbi:16S rRNA (adenine(1518)-N(6)/adenine(1519)-N(6))-dimethyltransferase RsmA [Peptococcus simiae]|uniref:16S rRNA (adenine(1518)-N(6)/adenine(1519)-N(6))- dimethyltransferase RsmA n=1 Tax=Peptococcus simiae TaxID=1643805 RepID=UPI0039808B90
MQRSFRHKKKFGQNFLTDPALLDKIARLCPPGPAVLEIGAGAGALTRALAKRFPLVAALEIDRDLAPLLEANLAGCDNVHLAFADAGKIHFDAYMADLGAPQYAIVANLPYYITTPLLMQAVEENRGAEDMIFMVQKEVADRLAARPGNKSYGAVTVAVQYRCQVDLALQVGRKAFTPAPEVDSTVVRLKRRVPDIPTDPTAFRQTVRAAFSQRRKTLRNSLKATGLAADRLDRALEACAIDPTRRAETLSVNEFAQLSQALYPKEKG